MSVSREESYVAGYVTINGILMLDHAFGGYASEIIKYNIKSS